MSSLVARQQVWGSGVGRKWSMNLLMTNLSPFFKSSWKNLAKICIFIVKYVFTPKLKNFTKQTKTLD
jgi:hypothetical protein